MVVSFMRQICTLSHGTGRSIALAALLAACTPAQDQQSAPRDTPAPRDSVTQSAPSPAADSTARDSAERAERMARIEAEFDESPLPPPPKIEGYPIVYENSCVGEICQSDRVVRACADMPLRDSASKDAPLSLVLKKGDTALARQDLHVIAPGIVVAKRDFAHDHAFDDDGNRVSLADTIHFARGDTVLLLSYGQLGMWNASYRGRKFLADEFWGAPPRWDRLGGVGTDSTNAVLRSEHYMDTWWRIQLPDGRFGWKLRDHDGDLKLMIYRYPDHQWEDKCPQQ